MLPFLLALTLCADPAATKPTKKPTAKAAPSTTPLEKGATVSVVAVGHIMMGTNYPPEHQALPADGGQGIFDPVKDVLTKADVAFGNLAAPFSERGATAKKVDGIGVFAFRTPPAYVAHLKEAGFDVVQAANNHIRDFGMDAYDDTLSTLDDAGIAHVGRKGDLYLTEKNGITVGVMGFTQPYNDTFASHHDLEAAAETVRAAKKKCDVLIVGLHGGTEGKDSLHTPRKMEYLGQEPRGEVVKAARAFVDAGADLVVGFGPHLPRAIEFYQGKLIDYSLGNFLTYGPFNLRGPSGFSLILEATFDKQAHLVSSKVYPYVVEKPGLLHVDPLKQTITHLRQLSKEDFPESYPSIADDGALSPHAQ